MEASQSLVDKQPPDIKQRLAKHIQIDQVTNCWNWQGATASGYGVMNINSKLIGAHRVSYSEYVGDIPAGMRVLHECDNPRCVNPAHLVAGTQKKNMQDMVKRGRNRHGVPAGEKNGHCKLKQFEVRQIRDLLAWGGMAHQEIASLYKVSRSLITKIKKGEVWGLGPIALSPQENNIRAEIRAKYPSLRGIV
jgi:hypothetical protein